MVHRQVMRRVAVDAVLSGYADDAPSHLGPYLYALVRVPHHARRRRSVDRRQPASIERDVHCVVYELTRSLCGPLCTVPVVKYDFRDVGQVPCQVCVHRDILVGLDDANTSRRQGERAVRYRIRIAWSRLRPLDTPRSGQTYHPIKSHIRAYAPMCQLSFFKSSTSCSMRRFLSIRTIAAHNPASGVCSVVDTNLMAIHSAVSGLHPAATRCRASMDDSRNGTWLHCGCRRTIRERSALKSGGDASIGTAQTAGARGASPDDVEHDRFERSDVRHKSCSNTRFRVKP